MRSGLPKLLWQFDLAVFGLHASLFLGLFDVQSVCHWMQFVHECTDHCLLDVHGGLRDHGPGLHDGLYVYPVHDRVFVVCPWLHARRQHVCSATYVSWRGFGG